MNRTQVQIDLEASCFMHEVFSANEIRGLNEIEKQNMKKGDLK